MNKIKKNIILGIVFLCMFIVGFGSAKLFKGEYIFNIDTLEIRPMTYNYDTISYVSCHSNSMNQAFNCNDKLYLTKINKNHKLNEGDVYVFINNLSNETIVHRLVYCPNEECNPAIFKGDGNKIADKPIYREQILYKVDGVEYR